MILYTDSPIVLKTIITNGNKYPSRLRINFWFFQMQIKVIQFAPLNPKNSAYRKNLTKRIILYLSCILTILSLLLIAPQQLMAQKLFIIGETDYNFTSDLKGKTKYIHTNKAIGIQKIKSMTSGSFGGAIGLGLEYGKYEIIGKWNHSNIGLNNLYAYNSDYEQTIILDLANSKITQNTFTIGGKYHISDGLLQPYIGANFGILLWRGKIENEKFSFLGAQFQQGLIRFSGNGSDLVAGISMGADYNLSNQVSLSAGYAYNYGFGEKNLKFQGPKLNIGHTENVIYSAYGTHTIMINAKIHF